MNATTTAKTTLRSANTGYFYDGSHFTATRMYAAELTSDEAALVQKSFPIKMESFNSLDRTASARVVVRFKDASNAIYEVWVAEELMYVTLDLLPKRALEVAENVAAKWSLLHRDTIVAATEALVTNP